jgi:hypothetical protein
MNDKSQLLPDHMFDGMGRQVPIELIKKIDLWKDEFVNNSVKEAEAMQDILMEFKIKQFDLADELKKKINDELDIKLGGQRGNVTFKSYDQELKVNVSVQVNKEADSEFTDGINIVLELLDKWTEGANKNAVAYIQKKMRGNSEGVVSLSEALSLRHLEIDDPSGRWNAAMKLIADSMKETSSSRFIRYYKKDENGKSVAIPLDIAKL